MDVHFLEGHFTHELLAHDDHTGHPEEEDVEAGNENAGGIVLLQRFGIFGPAHSGEGPQGGGEPGVEDVRILLEVGATALGAGGHIFLRHDELAAVGAGPGGDTVAPPDLAADAPVADIVEPVVVGLGPVLRIDLDVAGNGGAGAGSQLGEGHEPLVGNVGFDDGLTAVAATNAVAEGLFGHEMTVLAQFFHDGLTAVFAAHASVLTAQGFVLHHVAVVVDNLDEFEVMGVAEVPVVGVMARRDLEATSTEFTVHVTVGNEGDLAVGDGQDELLAHEAGVAFIFRMHAHGGVAQHGFGAGGGDGHRAGTVGEVVADMPEHTLGVDVIHFVVGKGGVATGAPVDNVLALVDEAVLVELDKDLAHGAGEVLVHSEGFAGPVNGSAKALDLLEDLAAVLLLPFPHAFHKGFAAEVMAALAFLGKGTFHHVLGGDTGVVSTGNPEHVLALLAGMAAEHVLKGLVQGMADVKDTGDVGRRNDDGIRIARGGQVGSEGLLFFPVLAPVSFHFLRFIGFGQHLQDSSRFNIYRTAPLSCGTFGLCVCIEYGGKHDKHLVGRFPYLGLSASARRTIDGHSLPCTQRVRHIPFRLDRQDAHRARRLCAA